MFENQTVNKIKYLGEKPGLAQLKNALEHQHVGTGVNLRKVFRDKVAPNPCHQFFIDNFKVISAPAAMPSVIRRQAS